MDRLKEYQELVKDSNVVPDALDDLVFKAHKRVKVRRVYRRFGQAIAMFVLLIGVFTLSVNSSIKIAHAMGKIPIISDLAKKVALSPSLKAAVDNEYVQPMNLSETKNGITVRVEYLIVDKKQVNIFYRVDGPYRDEWEIPSKKGKEFAHTIKNSSDTEDNSNVLRRLEVNFTDEDVPSSLTLQCKLSEKDDQDNAQSAEQKVVAEYQFDLEFDSQYINKGDVVAIKKWVELDGQNIYLDQVGIYPTHVQLDLKDNNENTAWLRGLDYRIVGEDGKILAHQEGGITGFGSIDSPFMESHRLGSNYFSPEKVFKMEITGVEWLDKSLQSVTINLSNNTASLLPEGIQLMECIKTKNGWDIVFHVDGDEGVSMHLPFGWDYSDLEGNKYSFSGLSTDTSTDQTGYTVTLRITDYKKQTIILNTEVTRYSEFEEPKIIEITR